MFQRISFASLALLAMALTGCGTDNNQPVVGTYGYVQNGGINGHNICPGQVVQDWENLVAIPCSTATGPGSYCGQGIQMMIQRDGAFIQGPGCGIPTASTRWCPGDNWRGQAYFDININVLQALLTRFGGPGSYPLNNGGFTN